MEMNMNAKYFRDLAEKNYAGKINQGALAYFLVALIVGAATAITFGIASILIVGPMMIGLCIFTKEIHNGKGDVNDIFKGFNNFVNAFLLYLLEGIYLVLWTLLLYIPALVKMFSYSMSAYIMLDNPEMSPNQAITESRKLMDGYKWRLFCLQFSYIGWLLLCALTFGILSFWVSPKMEMAKYEFYLQIKKDKGLNKPVQNSETIEG